MDIYKWLEYPKIQTVFKRDEKTYKIIEGQMTLPEFEYLQKNIWSWTEKVDWTNIRVCWKDGKLSMWGRTNDAQIPPRVIEKLQSIFETEAVVAYLCTTFPNESEVVFFGEAYGDKVQKAWKMYWPVNFVLFDINIDGWWLSRENMEDIATKVWLDVVPEYMQWTIAQAIEMVRSWTSSAWGDFIAEGLVWTPKIPLYSKKWERLMVKIKHRDFNHKYILWGKSLET